MDASRLLGSLLGNNSMGSNVLSVLLKGGGGSAGISGLLGSLMGDKSGSGGQGSILGGLMGGGGAQPQAAQTPAPASGTRPGELQSDPRAAGAPAIFRV